MEKIQSFILVCITISIFSLFHANAAERISYFQTDGRYQYRTELLRLAQSYPHASLPSSIELVPLPHIPHARGQRLIETNAIRGVMSLATNQQTERNFLPIRQPIMAGILGMRVLLIRGSQQQQFTQVNSIEQLRQLRLGFVTHWGDIEILRHNQMTVIPVSRYKTMFSMLSAGRFDFFPRGINEIIPELERFGGIYSQLTIEKQIALLYPYPVYFFVNKHDTKLANRIEHGLQQALDDGSFKRLFLKYHSDILKQLDFDKRRVYTLENHTLPPNTPVPDMSWWLDDTHFDKHNISKE